MKPYTKAQNLWTYETLKWGFSRTSSLNLVYEVSGAPISDNYTPEDESAEELLHMWVNEYGTTEGGHLNIYWSVINEKLGVYETAPFIGSPCGDFLTYFTKPTNARTGEHINWLRLPVDDKCWNQKDNDSGGFIQESTGWKPSPLQLSVYVPSLLRASGFGHMVPRELNV